MKGFHAAGLAVVAILLLLSAQAAAAGSQPNKVKQTAKPVWTIAMDGARVAYMSQGRVRVWNVVTGGTSVIGGNYPSFHKYGSTDNGDVAIAGRRVALVTRFVLGNSEETTERLFTARLGGAAHQIRSAFHVDSGSGWSGNTIQGLVGSGHVLAVSSWKSDGTVATHRQLSLVTPSRLRTIVGGPGSIVSGSADGAHIAVLRTPGTHTVGVYSAGGKLLREITPAGNAAIDGVNTPEIALSGHRLVVLTWPTFDPVKGFSGPGKTVEVYDWTTGKLVHTWPVATKTPNRLPGNLAVYGRLAVYAVDPRFAGPRKLHLLDLTTGKDVVIATAGGSGHRDAALGPRGLVYVVNYGRSQHGRLVFMPTAKLLGLVGR